MHATKQGWSEVRNDKCIQNKLRCVYLPDACRSAPASALLVQSDNILHDANPHREQQSTESYPSPVDQPGLLEVVCLRFPSAIRSTFPMHANLRASFTLLPDGLALVISGHEHTSYSALQPVSLRSRLPLRDKKPHVWMRAWCVQAVLQAARQGAIHSASRRFLTTYTPGRRKRAFRSAPVTLLSSEPGRQGAEMDIAHNQVRLSADPSTAPHIQPPATRDSG